MTIFDDKNMQIAIYEGRDIKSMLREWLDSIDIESPKFWENMCDLNLWMVEAYQYLYEMEKKKRIELEGKYGKYSTTG